MDVKPHCRRICARISLPMPDIRCHSDQADHPISSDSPGFFLSPPPGWQLVSLSKETKKRHITVRFESVGSDDEINRNIAELSRWCQKHAAQEMEVFDLSSPEYDSSLRKAWLDLGIELITDSIPSFLQDTAGSVLNRLVLKDTLSAFGTGNHPSTLCAANCLSLLAKKGELQDAAVLDVGTGSGILAMTALVFGASCAYAIDIDPRAIQAARENIAVNSMSDRIVVDDTPLGRLKSFRPDVIIANLTPAVLHGLLDELGRLLLPTGSLILSGFRSGSSMDLELQKWAGQQGLIRAEDCCISGWKGFIVTPVR